MACCQANANSGCTVTFIKKKFVSKEMTGHISKPHILVQILVNLNPFCVLFHAAVIGTHGDECFADDKVSATDPDSEGERMRQRHREPERALSSATAGNAILLI